MGTIADTPRTLRYGRLATYFVSVWAAWLAFAVLFGYQNGDGGWVNVPLYATLFLACSAWAIVFAWAMQEIRNS